MTVDKSSERVRRMFASIAGRYDALNRILSLGIDRWWRRQTVRLAPAPPGGCVLDVCCGTGDLSLAYARGGHCRVIGADFCRPMLLLARRKAPGPAGPRFVEADAQQLPFAAGSFDVVCVAFGLRNVADTDRGLAEMVRVCRSGGRVAVLEFSMPRRWPLRTLYGWYFGTLLPRVGQWLARNSEAAYNYLPASVAEFPQAEAMLQKMAAAGLKQTVQYPMTAGVATLYVGVK